MEARQHFQPPSFKGDQRSQSLVGVTSHLAGGARTLSPGGDDEGIVNGDTGDDFGTGLCQLVIVRHVSWEVCLDEEKSVPDDKATVTAARASKEGL